MIYVTCGANLNLLGTMYSYDDYQHFYDENFQPLELNPELLPKEEEPLQRYEDELTPEELKRLEQQRSKNQDEEQFEDDGGEWY